MTMAFYKSTTVMANEQSHTQDGVNAHDACAIREGGERASRMVA
jgi:hypothetical protein